MAITMNPNVNSAGIQTVDEALAAQRKKMLQEETMWAERDKGKKLSSEEYKKIKDAVDETCDGIERIIKAQEDWNKLQNSTLSGQLEITKNNLKILEQEKDRNAAIIDAAKNNEKLRVQAEEAAQRNNQLDEERNRQLAERNRLEVEMLRASKETVSEKEKQAILEERIKRNIEKQAEIDKKYNEQIRAAKKSGDTQKAKELQQQKKDEEKENGLGGVAGIFGAAGGGLGGLMSLFGKGGGGGGGLGSLLGGSGGGGGLGGAIGNAVGGKLGGMFTSFLGKGSPIIAAVKAVASVIGKVQEQLDTGVKQAVQIQTEYLGKINSRLQGSTQSFARFQNDFGASFGKSGIINQQHLIKTIGEMVDKGIAFNVEQRAILQDLKDSMVTTFDATNAELLRLIRIQQQDLTAGQLGYEALLTQFLNKNFEDTSYLSQVYDSIASELMEATSQLSAQGASEFSFEVQKWLGSMYALGMSQEGVSKLAKGIGYLATGDVEALNSDDALRTLFASATGGAYSSILTGGLNAATVNELMSSVVTYLRAIAGDTNQVTKKAMAGAFGGLSLSDLRALQNMTDETVLAIKTTVPSYSEALSETYQQLQYATTVYSRDDETTNARIGPAQLFENSYANILYEYGSQIAGEMGSYRTHRLATLAEENGGKIGKIAGGIMKFFNGLFSGDNPITALVDMVDTTLSSEGRFRDKFMGSLVVAPMIQALQGGNTAATRFLSATRGDAATLPTMADLNTQTGFSIMSRLDLNSGGIADLTNTTASRAVQTTTTGEAVTRDVSDLYAELFERQSTSMKVSLSDIDSVAGVTLASLISSNTKSSVDVRTISDDALKSLSETMRTDKLESIDDKLSGTIQVSSQEDFMASINGGLSYARGI